MSRGRWHHTCNLVTHSDGTRDIVIVGGQGDNSCKYGNKDVEIVHLDSNTEDLDSGNNYSLLLQKSLNN